jgi:hypothetical protein
MPVATGPVRLLTTVVIGPSQGRAGPAWATWDTSAAMPEMTGVTSFLSDLVGLVVWKCTIYSSWKKDTGLFGWCLIPLDCK